MRLRGTGQKATHLRDPGDQLADVRLKVVAAKLGYDSFTYGILYYDSFLGVDTHIANPLSACSIRSFAGFEGIEIVMGLVWAFSTTLTNELARMLDDGQRFSKVASADGLRVSAELCAIVSLLVAAVSFSSSVYERWLTLTCSGLMAASCAALAGLVWS